MLRCSNYIGSMKLSDGTAHRKRQAQIRSLEGGRLPLIRIGIAVLAAAGTASAIASLSTL